MKKKWLVALYKINEVKRLESNLLNQNLDFYIPKITIKKINSTPKVEALFPGYIFVNTNLENYSSLKYTMGIKNILKFGDNIPFISNEDIKIMRIVEESSKTNPSIAEFKIGQEVTIKEGSLKGMMVKIFSLPSRERVGVLLNFLGSSRKVLIPEKNIVV